jgi:tetratricopeptide (TPR) repeat protein
MRDESGLPDAPESGLIFWVTPGNRRVTWLRYSGLILLLPVLYLLFTSFSGAYAPDAPAHALLYTASLVILIRGWMLVIDLVYRLPSRALRFVQGYLIAFGITALLALSVCGMAWLLDVFLSPTGHFFALQGMFVILLTLCVAPIALIILHQEPLSYYWQAFRASDGAWADIEEPLRVMLHKHPDALRPALLLLETLLRLNQRDEARGLLRRLLAAHPQAWGGWAALGALALEDEQWERAIKALKRARSLAPRMAQGSLQLSMGLALLGAGDLDGGYQEIDRARRRSLPPHLRHFIWFMLMRIGQVQQDPGLMLRANNAVKASPKDAHAFLTWYATLDRSQAPTLAEDLYEAADWTRHQLGIRQVI